jgi:hypothetical protein
MAPPAGYAADLAVRADLVTVARAEARYHRAHGSYAAAATLFARHRPLAHVTAGTRIRLGVDGDLPST